MTDNSSYTKIIPFGKYAGMSLGYIKEVNSGYLTWMTAVPTMPKAWKEAAALVLEGKSVDHIKVAVAANAPKIDFKASVYKAGKDTLWVEFDYSKELVERFKRAIDGRAYDAKAKKWKIPAVQINKLVELFGMDNLDADDFTKKIWRDEKKRRIDLDEIRDRMSADIEINTLVPLRPYQLAAVDFVQRAGGRALIADVVGLGKTASSIGYAVHTNAKTLVICPKSVISQWKREITRFTGKTSTVWNSKTKEGRVDAKFHISGYDSVPKQIQELNNIKWDLIIIDEAVYIKNPATIRSKSIIGHYKSRKKYPGLKSKDCILLTGSLILSRPSEVFSLLSYLDKKRFNNFFNFCSQYGGFRGDPARNLEELHHRIQDLVIRRTVKDVKMELPEKQRTDIIVEMTKKEREQYNKYLKEMFGEWALAGKPSITNMPKIQNYLFDIKQPRTIEIIDEMLASDRGILVFSVFKEPLYKLMKHYPDDAILFTGDITNNDERQNVIDQLATGKKKIGLMSLGASAMGIDSIQKSIDAALFLNMGWTPAIHEQSEGRIHRSGQQNPVNIYYLLCDNTIDEDMRDILSEKQKIVDTVVDGKPITLDPNRSFFKEFVQKIKFQTNVES